MKEKFKEWAMTLRLRDCKDPNCAYCGAANLLDRLASLPDEAPKPWREVGTINNGMKIVEFVTEEYANYYRDSFFAAQARIAELETKLAYAKDAAAKGEAARLAVGGMELRIAELEKQLAEAQQPIECILYCPRCRTQHIDAPELPDWSNPPHKSHLCHACAEIWRPSDHPTYGVEFIKTKGSGDTLDMRGLESINAAIKGDQS